MKHIILSSLFSCFALTPFAQSNTVCAGAEGTGTGGSVSFTLGQIDYVNSSGTNGSLNQGVQQPFEFFKNNGLFESSLIVSNIYPNPTTEYVILEIGEHLKGLSYCLYDLNGKRITSNDISGIQTYIPMQTLSSGQYQLNIIQGNETIESIKIIKH